MRLVTPSQSLTLNKTIILFLWIGTAISGYAQTFTLLVDFSSIGNPQYESLVQGPDGNFYGTTPDTVFRMTPNGSLTTLYTFCSQPNCTDGQDVLSGLVLASDGNFYGTTNLGGGFSCAPQIGGCGTVFRITPHGTLTTIHRFQIWEGNFPLGALVQGSDGNLYGTTAQG